MAKAALTSPDLRWARKPTERVNFHGRYWCCCCSYYCRSYYCLLREEQTELNSTELNLNLTLLEMKDDRLLGAGGASGCSGTERAEVAAPLP